MSELKFTPGEWEVYYIPKCSYEHIRIDAGEQRVATVNHVGRNDQERNANAYLMAASKDTYESLKELVEEFGHRLPSPYIDRARAALAKAEGGQK